MTRPVSAHFRESTFDPKRITGPSVAIYDCLSDGKWHTRDQIIAATAAMVPAARGYRESIRPGTPAPTGVGYTAAVVRGQRKLAGNRLMIQVRGRHVIQDPQDTKRYRLADGIADAWTAHQDEQ